MKTLSIVAVSLVLSALTIGSFKPLMPQKNVNRGPALEKTYKPLKSDIQKYLLAVSK